jgi:predicted dehydrogenase
MRRVVLAGWGFFGPFHADAWQRLAPGWDLAGLADPDPAARARFQAAYPGVPTAEDVDDLLEAVRPDVVDVVTRPAQHESVARAAFARGVAVIVQKPLAPTWGACVDLVRAAAAARVRLLVHDNWRFQPWWTTVAAALVTGAVGRPYYAHFRVRPGDGRGAAPYPAQPYFRDMPRFFFYETGVHYVDLTRALFGRVRRAHAVARRLRSDIAGEDLGVALLETEQDVVVVLDGNRWGEAADPNPAFGTATIEGTAGRLDVTADGAVWLKPLGAPARCLRAAQPERRGYRGDSVAATVRHLATALETGRPSPLEGRAYLETMAVVFRLYGDPVDDGELNGGEEVGERA